jgi:hypothetical protein
MAPAAIEGIAHLLLRGRADLEAAMVQFFLEYYTDTPPLTVGECTILRDASKWTDLHYYVDGEKVEIRQTEDEFEFVFQGPLYRQIDSWEYTALVNTNLTSRFTTVQVGKALHRPSKLFIRAKEDTYYLKGDYHVTSSHIVLYGETTDGYTKEELEITEPINYVSERVWTYLEKVEYLSASKSGTLYVDVMCEGRDTSILGVWSIWREGKPYFIRAANVERSVLDIEEGTDTLTKTDPIALHVMTNVAELTGDYTLEYGILYSMHVDTSEFNGLTSVPGCRYIYVMDGTTLKTLLYPQVFNIRAGANDRPSKRAAIILDTVANDSPSPPFTDGCKMLVKILALESGSYRLVHEYPDGTKKAVAFLDNDSIEISYSSSVGDMDGDVLIPVTFTGKGTHSIVVEWEDELTGRAYQTRMAVPINTATGYREQALSSSLSSPSAITLAHDGRLMVLDGGTLKVFDPFYNIAYYDREQDVLYIPTHNDVFGTFTG